jgi:hypothetical protein
MNRGKMNSVFIDFDRNFDINVGRGGYNKVKFLFKIGRATFGRKETTRKIKT